MTVVVVTHDPHIAAALRRARSRSATAGSAPRAGTGATSRSSDGTARCSCRPRSASSSHPARMLEVSHDAGQHHAAPPRGRCVVTLSARGPGLPRRRPRDRRRGRPRRAGRADAGGGRTVRGGQVVRPRPARRAARRRRRGEVTLDGVPVRVGDLALRRRVGLVLQGYGLVTALTGAGERRRRAAGPRPRPCRGPRAGGRRAGRGRAQPTSPATSSTTCPAGSNNASPWRARWRRRRTCCWPTSRRPSSTPTTASGSSRCSPSTPRTGAIVVVASHDPDVIEVCDDVVELDAGRVVVDPAHTRA